MSSSPTHPPAEPDPRVTCLARGADLFNRQQFFEAHEVWEDAWRESQGEERRFFQGLIQCAVAPEHARRGNARSALRMSKRYPAKFAGLPTTFMGLDVEAVLAAMDRAIGSPGPVRPRIQVDFASKLPGSRID